MSVSVQQRIQEAWNAGFRNTAAIESLTIIVAISLCECGVGSASGCETGCVPDCCPPAPSCGVLQIYQPAHPGTAACASDSACCFTLGWQISNHGTSFSPWSTYADGCFRQHLSAVRAAIAGMPAPIGSAAPPSPPAPTPLCPPGYGWDGSACEPGAGPTPTPAPAPPGAGGGPSPLLLLALAGAAGGAALYEHRHPGVLGRQLGRQLHTGRAQRLQAGHRYALPVHLHVDAGHRRRGGFR